MGAGSGLKEIHTKLVSPGKRHETVDIECRQERCHGAAECVHARVDAG